MKNEMAASQQLGFMPPVTLHTVWHVEGDATYRVTQPMMEQGADLVALRTLDGVGEVQLEGGRLLTVSKGTLLLLAKAQIHAYRVRYDRWHFYWFEFSAPQVETLPLGTLLELPLAPGEEGEMARCFETLKAERGWLSALPQAMFQYRLCDWLATTDKRERQMGQEELILLLAQGVRERLSVAELARRACMCERSFRLLVHRYTGKSPKEYMLHDALDTALALLRRTGLPVHEVAATVGFTNAFYFSRAFKRRFGMQPSKVRVL